MENFHSNDTISNHNNTEVLCMDFIKEDEIFTSIYVCICLILTFVAIYSLYTQVQNDHVAPIYVINLLMSDLIQLCCMIIGLADIENKSFKHIFLKFTYCFGLISSIGFMVSIASERYLVIAHPLWYRFKRTIKSSLLVCSLVWVFSFVVAIGHYFESNLGLLCLIPLPLLLFFLIGTIKALSAVISVPSDEKRRIVALLVVVLIVFLLVLLPNIIINILFLDKYNTYVLHIRYLSCQSLKLNPLMDLVLNVFMKKWAIDRVLARLCCCKMDRNDISKTAA